MYSLASCSHLIKDYTPVDMCVEVVDSDGNSLLDTSVEGNWSELGFSAVYNGEKYDLKVPKSKVLLTTFYGIELRDFVHLGKWVVYFGELDGGQKTDAEFSIYWPDGSSDNFKLTHYSKPYTTKIQINGKDATILNERWNLVQIVK